MKTTSFFTWILILFLNGLLSPLVASTPEDQEIVIQLATESELQPVFIKPFVSSEPSFDNAYLLSLKKVLEFDFNHNGTTLVASATSNRLALVDREKNAEGCDFKAWKALNISYVLQPYVEKEQIYIKVYSISKNSLKKSVSMTLTGHLSEDRRQIHKLSDQIYKTLFGKEGIASTHFLYSLKVKSRDLTDSNGISEIWECDYDGANAKQLTHENRYCLTPAYVPGKAGFSPGTFLYVSYRSGQSKIYFASLKDGVGHLLLSLRGTQLMPAVSPTRGLVAFICDVGGNPDLFIQPFDATSGVIEKPRQIFASVRGTQASPTFNPSGDQIAFVSNKDGSPRIYKMEIPPIGMALKEMKPKLISKQNKENTCPTWSPDGRKLAYSAMTQGTRQIWIYDFDRSEERQLTSGPGHKENPSWAPDSLHLVFNSDSPELGTCELYLVNLNQPEATKISSGTGEKRFPSWEPHIY